MQKLHDEKSKISNVYNSRLKATFWKNQIKLFLEI